MQLAARCLATVNAAVTAVPHEHLLSMEKAHPANLHDLHSLQNNRL